MHNKALHLAKILRLTANRLESGAAYQWAHQGRCNCGHLAQTITGLSAGDIHTVAIQSEGEWADHTAEYCETSGLPVDNIIRTILKLGIKLDELGDLEKLSAPAVTRWLPEGRPYLDYRSRDDVILYFRTWAMVVEAREAILRDPSEEIRVHGKPFVLRERPENIQLALDENPAAGTHAA